MTPELRTERECGGSKSWSNAKENHPQLGTSRHKGPELRANSALVESSDTHSYSLPFIHLFSLTSNNSLPVMFFLNLFGETLCCVLV